MLECREKFGVGAVCDTEENCKSPLLCGGLFPYRQCYDPNLSLALGQECDPNAPSSGKVCVVEDDGTSMGCLPKGEAYACQKLAELYERCDAVKNVACSPRSMTVCDEDGVCVPNHSFEKSV